MLEFTSYHDDIYFLSVEGNDATINVNQLSGNSIDADEDSDGLSDFQELMIKTNLLSKDTDNDGVNDFSEYKSGKNPLTKTSFVPDNTLKGTTYALAYEVPYRNKPFELNMRKPDSNHWIKLFLHKDETVVFRVKSRLNNFNNGWFSEHLDVYLLSPNLESEYHQYDLGDGFETVFSITANASGFYYLKLKNSSSSKTSSIGYAEITVYDPWWSKSSVLNNFNQIYANAASVSDENQFLPIGRGATRIYKMLVKRDTKIRISAEALRKGMINDYISFSLHNSSYEKIKYFDRVFVGDSPKAFEKEVYLTGVYYLKVEGDATFRMQVDGVERYDLDTDGDKLTDIIEFAIGTDENKKDTDKDGVDDYKDFYPLNAKMTTPYLFGRVFFDGFEK